MKTLLTQQIFLAHRATYFPQLLKTSLLSETIFSQAQAAFFMSKFSNNNHRIKCEICSNLTIEAPHIALLSLLLTLNIFARFSIFADLENVNAG